MSAPDEGALARRDEDDWVEPPDTEEEAARRRVAALTECRKTSRGLALLADLREWRAWHHATAAAETASRAAHAEAAHPRGGGR